MLTLMLPTVVSSLLDVLWVVDHSWYTQETVKHEIPSSVAVLDTLKSVHLAPTTIPRSNALNSFVLPNHALNSTHTQSMSQLSQVLKILLWPPPFHLHQVFPNQGYAQCRWGYAQCRRGYAQCRRGYAKYIFLHYSSGFQTVLLYFPTELYICFFFSPESPRFTANKQYY